MEGFGKRLKEARIALGITQKEAAARVGIFPPNYSDYEADKKEPTVSMAVRLAQAVDCSLDYLCGTDISGVRRQYEREHAFTYDDAVRMIDTLSDAVNLTMTIPDEEKIILQIDDQTIAVYLKKRAEILSSLDPNSATAQELFNLWDKVERQKLKEQYTYAQAIAEGHGQNGKD